MKKDRIAAGLLSGVLWLALAGRPGYAQGGRLPERLMPEGLRAIPSSIRWADNEHYFLSDFDSARNTLTVSKVDARSGEAAPYTGTPGIVPPPRLQVKANDIYLVRGVNAERITQTPDLEKTNPELSPDGALIAFTRKNDLYLLDVRTEAEKRLTQDGSAEILNGYSSWLYNEEILGRQLHYRAFWWSPDSKQIAFLRTDDSGVPEFTYTDADADRGIVRKQRYPQPGDPNPQVKVGVVSVADGSIRWSDIDEKIDHYIGEPYWQPDSQALLVQWLDRAQKNYRLLAVDPTSGRSQSLYEETQPTWINLDEEQRLTFLGKTNDFLFISDKSGYRQIYRYDSAAKTMSRVSNGDFVVRRIVLTDSDTKVVYFIGNGENLVNDDLYRVGLDGKNQKRLTFGSYSHEINPSPDGAYFLTRYSNAETPERLTLIDNQGKIVREVADSRTPDYDSAKLPTVNEVLFIKSADGKFDLPVRINRPSKLKAGKKYPLFIAIYGGPGSTNVNNRFSAITTRSSDDSGEMIYAYMDHRGAYEFGKAGQNSMYRQLGRWEVEDWSQIVRWLISNRPVDPERVEISGYSYGGYATCYVMENAPDLFKFGVAGGSVTDWKLYDTAYTERYMGTPKENPEGYKNSSVLTNAARLQGRLLLTHGIADDNVHVINALAFIARLEELNKNFEMMLYPGNTHSVIGPKLGHYNLTTKQFMQKYMFGSADKTAEKIADKKDN